MVQSYNPGRDYFTQRRGRSYLPLHSSSVIDQVKDVVAEQLGVEKDKISPESNFINDLGADSLDSVELVMAFEEKFGIEIPDDKATGITTVQDAVNYVEQNKKE
eukprot:GHVU01040286.1.p1 GENE.GHVU01040286.1~~GHVU01040286.1.p1  ORF type:complete len:104 (+),score=18.12 GHVU01040286.1:251-562(+)